MRAMVISLLSNEVLLTAVISMFIAQVIKIIYYYILEKKFNWFHIFEAGGMPSSHSALVCSLTLMVGLSEGFDSVLFAAVAVIAAIVMYDAMKVRAEEVGHTLVEVSTGGILGIIVSLMLYFNYFRG
jgi:hypothetical protein